MSRTATSRGGASANTRTTIGELARRVTAGNTAAIVLAASSLLAGAAGFVYWTIIGRGTSTENVGAAASWLALLPLLGTAAAVGQSENIVRHLWHTDPSHLLRRAYATVAAGCAVLAIAAAILPVTSTRTEALFHHPSTAIAVTAAALAATTMSSLASAVALARKRPLLLLWDALPAAAVKIALAPFAAGSGPTAIALASIAGAAVGSVAVNVAVWRLEPMPKAQRTHVGKSYAAGTLAAALISALPGSLTPAMIASSAGENAAAMAAIPLMLLPGLTLIPASIARSLMADGSAHLDQAVRMTVQRAKQATALSALISGAVAVAAPLILSLIGSSYSQAVTPLRLCALAAFVATPGYMLETLLSIQKRVALYTATSIITTAISLVGSIVYAGRGPSHVFAVWAAAGAAGTIISAIANLKPLAGAITGRSQAAPTVDAAKNTRTLQA